ncbi:MAG: hypothetical protein QM449_09450, partial [Synergistota bacterium]|nr:hypothetical protein [Synergistota bacterium]
YLRWSEQQGTGFSHANSGMKIPHPALGKKFCTSGEFRLAKNIKGAIKGNPASRGQFFSLPS